MQPLITPVMIVRDEERFLAEALSSLTHLRSVLARTCVYDTGSVDSTVAIARRAGATVTEGYWDDDFARAKNESAAMAGTKWVLSLDADERLVGDPRRLTAAVQSAERSGLESLVFEVDDVRAGEVVNTVPGLRLFRFDQAHFRNRIHEIVVRRDGSPRRAAKLPRETLHLRHVGYGPGEAMERRRERNSRIGDLEVEAARRRGDDVLHLVEALVNRGRSRSVGGDWAAGISDWLEARSLSVATPFGRYAGELLARAYIETNQVREAAGMLAVLRREGCDPNLVAWLTASAFALADRPEQTVQALYAVQAPVSALGERYSIVPLLQTRMLAAAKIGQTDLAIEDAVQLMAAHGVNGFARLLLLMWGNGEPGALAARLGTAGRHHLAKIAGEFEALGIEGEAMASAVRRSVNQTQS